MPAVHCNLEPKQLPGNGDDEAFSSLQRHPSAPFLVPPVAIDVRVADNHRGCFVKSWVDMESNILLSMSTGLDGITGKEVQTESANGWSFPLHIHNLSWLALGQFLNDGG